MRSEFLDSPPDRIEVRRGVVYYVHGDAVYTQPIAAALVTFEMGREAIEQWMRTHQDTVVPFERR